MPVDFLGDADVATYGRIAGLPTREELGRDLFLDDGDLALIDRRREDHVRLGGALQLTTVRAVGAFLVDPADVPPVVVDYLAEQLGIANGSCLVAYSARRTTRFEHAEQIRRAYGLLTFADVAKELEVWIDARAWTTGRRLSRGLLKWGGDPSPVPAVLVGVGGPPRHSTTREGSPCPRRYPS